VSKTGKRKLKDRFLDWQCQLRQTAMRDDGGRPSAGMQPQLLDETGGQLAPALTVLLLPKAPEESTAFFRFQVTKSPDPRETYEKTLRFLQSEFFHDPKLFSGKLLAVLPDDAPLAKTLLASGRCVLDFSQGRHGFRVPCRVKALAEKDDGRDAAIWHNRVFNPALPDTVQVLVFKPQWKTAEIKF
jgi:hypothetical protein